MLGTYLTLSLLCPLCSYGQNTVGRGQIRCSQINIPHPPFLERSHVHNWRNRRGTRVFWTAIPKPWPWLVCIWKQPWQPLDQDQPLQCSLSGMEWGGTVELRTAWPTGLIPGLGSSKFGMLRFSRSQQAAPVKRRIWHNTEMQHKEHWVGTKYFF